MLVNKVDSIWKRPLISEVVAKTLRLYARPQNAYEFKIILDSENKIYGHLILHIPVYVYTCVSFLTPQNELFPLKSASVFHDKNFCLAHCLSGLVPFEVMSVLKILTNIQSF